MRTYINGVLVQWDDDVAFEHHYYDPVTGTELASPQSPVAYTATEKAAAQARALAVTQGVNEETIGDKIATVDLPAMAAILAQTNADLRADPSQELKDIARAVRRLDRKIMRILDGVD